MTLTTLGGVLGVLLAGAITLAINLFAPELPARMSLFWIALGVLVSSSVGILYGIWPAYKASRLDPIECLWYV